MPNKHSTSPVIKARIRFNRIFTISSFPRKTHSAIVNVSLFDPAYGARPLKRYIQSHLETLIARKLVAGELFPSQVVTVDADTEGRLIVVDGTPPKVESPKANGGTTIEAEGVVD